MNCFNAVRLSEISKFLISMKFAKTDIKFEIIDKNNQLLGESFKYKICYLFLAKDVSDYQLDFVRAKIWGKHLFSQQHFLADFEYYFYLLQ